MPCSNDTSWSRRAILRMATTLTAGTAMGLSTREAWAAKASKADVAYQDVPKGNEICTNCVLFEAPNQCTSVAGEVNGNGWCRIWVEKKAV